MKMKSIIIFFLAVIFITACTDLDLNPLSEGSSQNWYSNQIEVEMAVNDLFRSVFWNEVSDEHTDNYTRREALTPVTAGTITSDWWMVNTYWSNTYKAVVRSNLVINNLSRIENDLPQIIVDKYAGNAYFSRASQYSTLISLFGDAIFFTEDLGLDEAFTMSRTDKNIILQNIYADYDTAIDKLPLSYGSSENNYATKGAAMAMKARIALYMSDWAVARDASKACIDLGIYELYPDFKTLFLSSTRNPNEVLFSLPRSRELGVWRDVRDFTSRLPGGWGGAQAPSWDLMSAFLCSDGLPIDESPLYNPREPFKNRDPRLTATIVEFGTEHLGYIYQPHPDSLRVLNVNTGNLVTNNDTRSNAAFASFNGLLWNKGVDGEWLINHRVDNDIVIIRYADVLLMYAEAKIELDEIDQSVLDAINRVRARAYGVDYTNTGVYPAVTTTNQSELRKIIRMERRMELAFENRRYMDIIRWRIAEQVLNTDIYGMLDVTPLRERVIQPGLWFFPDVPNIDENGIPDLSPMYDAGLVRRLAQRRFDATRQYLWPLPTSDIMINENLVQNPGY